MTANHHYRLLTTLYSGATHSTVHHSPSQRPLTIWWKRFLNVVCACKQKRPEPVRILGGFSKLKPRAHKLTRQIKFGGGPCLNFCKSIFTKFRASRAGKRQATPLACINPHQPSSTHLSRWLQIQPPALNPTPPALNPTTPTVNQNKQAKKKKLNSMGPRWCQRR
jgi:hypothetical protein